MVSIKLISHNLPSHITEEIQQDCGRILHRAKLPSPNVSKDEFQAIKHLNDNSHVLILKVDKGNAMVIMETNDYDAKMTKSLYSSSYKIIPKNPLNIIS